MLAAWLRWMPVVVIVWLARRRCEVVIDSNGVWATAFKDVLVRLR